VAILPIGTGNDLAIELGWGQCYMNEPLVSYLEQILHSEVTALDRWEMKFFALSQMKRADSFDQIMGE
jgi:diacylglycerol kinase family enzyme